MNGFAPLTHVLVHAALHPELHGIPYILYDHYCKLLEATPARNPAALLGLLQSFVSSVKFPHSCGSFGFHYLPPFPRPYTTTYPPCRLTYLVGLAGFGNYLVSSGCTYGLNTVHFHSIGFEVSFDAVSIRYTYRLAPWLLYLLSDLKKCFCLLTGFARCTTLGVRGRCRIRTCDVLAERTIMIHIIKFCAMPSTTRPTFQICLS